LTDFIHKTYEKLLKSFIVQDYYCLSFEQFINQINHKKALILRHDVDRLPKNALKMAQVEYEFGIQSTYYFRALPGIFKTEIIKQIAELGHEIGYHYEDMSLTNGNIDKAYESFGKNLEAFRKIYPVKTICMHGSPRSKWDSRDIWKKYDYKELGIIGEPYFDVDYSKVLYITDTGRKWNNAAVSVRDKVEVRDQRAESREQKSESRGQRSEDGNDKGKKNLQEFYSFKNTQDIIKAIEKNELPNQIMFNIHPHRWHDNYRGWSKELIMQNLKNIVKRLIVKYQKS
jgi:hypothetical protein